MNWDAIGSVGTMVGSIAVLVTLVYLSRQWRESNLLAKSTMAHTLATSFATINDLFIANPQAAELLARLKEPSAELSEAETIQAQSLAFRFFNNFV